MDRRDGSPLGRRVVTGPGPALSSVVLDLDTTKPTVGSSRSNGPSAKCAATLASPSRRRPPPAAPSPSQPGSPPSPTQPDHHRGCMIFATDTLPYSSNKAPTLERF